MRILVCGDRNWRDAVLVDEYLDGLLVAEGKPFVVIEGEARGADTFAGNWALRNRARGVELLSFPAQWHRYGKAAGPKRNLQMLDEGMPELVTAFHDNIANSSGTKNMIKLAKKRNLSTKLVTHHQGVRDA